MDGAILVISATEPCPQPQTREHLTALDIIGIKNIVIVQNKVDLVTPEDAKKHYEQIKAFVKGTVADNVPIIPVSAQQNINIDALIGAIEENIKTPERDSKKPPKLVIARAFDINKPGTPVAKLKGGIIGGSLLQGLLKIGDEVEIKPGLHRDGKYEPIKTKVVGLQKSMVDLDEVGPGGLLGVSTELDPSLSKSDSLAGNVVGHPGKLPDVVDEITFKPNLMGRVVGTKEELKVDPIRTGDMLMLTVSVVRTVGAVTSAGGGKITVKLKMPVCSEKGERVAIAKQVMNRWRLVGWGELL
jgi:translation initiation factor 2 subunit 3